MAAQQKSSKSELAKRAYDPALLQAMYKEMCIYRRFEEKVLQAYTQQKFAGFCHVHIGQEGVAVGVQKALRDSDYMISGYRSHTQAIGKGISPNQVFAELLGKKTGCVRGKGGSMHMFSKEKRFLGGHGIVGGQVPIATGVGFAIKYEKKDDIIVCYLGDAAANQGQFFEALNMAATWTLPCLFIIENNRYGMGTDIRRTTSVDHLYKRADAFDMDHSDVDGMNVLTVLDHVTDIVNNMRKTKRPYLLEVLCYRYKGHSVSDPGNYRSKDEVSEYQKKDPILQFKQYILEHSFFSEEELKTWDEEARQVARDAEEFGEKSEVTGIDDAWADVYV